ncbi:MAG: YhcH/YjgK/YiaL family protein [Melioribacteraceae bacterium]|nr:YhcH/YjgK/YiaL family protein [Melioribacteraceae bacterium]
MIYDNIKNISKYFPLDAKIQKALEYLSSTDFTNLDPGEYPIDGKNIYAIVSEYQTKPLTSGKWESHKKYIDIQFIVSGIEKMGFTESKKTIILNEYDEDKDVTLHKGEGQFIIVEEKHFVIFFTTDIHMPSIAVNIPKPVKKVVIKVAVEDIVEKVNSDDMT